MSNFNFKSGLGNAASFMVSGKPYMTTFTANANTGNVTRITFPSVTKSITLINNSETSGDDIRIAFSSDGLTTNGNYFVLHPSKDGVGYLTLDVKVTDIYVRSNGLHTPSVSIFASLTNISPTEINNNWEGSEGV